MTDEQKRQWVSELYPGPRWKKKVSKMSDAQVFAIWAKEHGRKDPSRHPDSEPDKTQDEIPF